MPDPETACLAGFIFVRVLYAANSMKLFYCTDQSSDYRHQQRTVKMLLHLISADQYSFAVFRCNSRISQLTERTQYP